MQTIRREIWGYAILLVILFTIASIAVWETISFFQTVISSAPGDEVIFPIVMLSLTLGFMMIAGAYGLWAIKFSAQTESRRRVGRFVDAMDYFTDGLLVVDRNRKIAGSNPAAISIAGQLFKKNMPVAAACPNLSSRDIDILLQSKEPSEFEATALIAGSPRTLRYRSQPSEDLTLIAISDITTMNSERAYNRQRARLQLVGHLARGMANDFNRLLCEISVHASLLQHIHPVSPEMRRSMEALSKNVESGMALTGNLLGLAQPDTAAQFTDSLEFHLNRTAGLLKDSLPQGWQVNISVQEDFPTICLTGIQVEQVVFNLGGLAADFSKTPGIIKIAAIKPSHNYLANINKECAAVIVVTTSTSDVAAIANQPMMQGSYGDAGIILSVIRSIIEEVNGTMEGLTAVDGAPVYRIGLPHGNYPKPGKEDSAELADEIKSYVAQWSVLLGGPAKELAPLQHCLKSIGARIENVDSIISVLSRIEENLNLDAIVISNQLLGQEARGLLKAMIKLRPSAGIVVLCENPDSESAGLSNEVVFISSRSNPNQLLTVLLEARSISASRKHRH